MRLTQPFIDTFRWLVSIGMLMFGLWITMRFDDGHLVFLVFTVGMALCLMLQGVMQAIRDMEAKL